jgi:hypothetical protein
MFESSNSLPIGKPEKTQAHYCMECYRICVDINVKNRMNWREGEKYDEAREKLKWELHKEYFFIFRREVVRRNLAASGLGKKG